jgi:hypothetical protein
MLALPGHGMQFAKDDDRPARGAAASYSSASPEGGYRPMLR